MTCQFDLEGVTYSYPGADRNALHRVDLSVGSGSLHALLGPNGSGKSTLLQVMLGEARASSGHVSFRGRPIVEWKRREIATQVAFVPQSEPLAFPLKVRELVEMGRYPHIGTLGRAGPDDRRAVEEAMEVAGVASFAARPITTLSGGELQRTRIARALAQKPMTLVLDEPTAALDLHFEMETFELMRRLAVDQGLTIVVATHNLNLAARYASHVLLLAEGHVEAAGSPQDVFTKDTLEKVYRWPIAVLPHPGPGHDAGVPQVVPLTPPRGVA
jgi:ABC-type cobalamin/Fe3+-siderophores transport system ATPase subunit